jgi:pimeloyl-ACP methyl ester carboxylesterase
MPANETYNSGHTERIDVPLLLIGGEHLFGPVFPRIAESLRSNYGWSNVRVHTMNDAKYYLAEERPEEVVRVGRVAGRTPHRPVATPGCRTL